MHRAGSRAPGSTSGLVTAHADPVLLGDGVDSVLFLSLKLLLKRITSRPSVLGEGLTIGSWCRSPV